LRDFLLIVRRIPSPSLSCESESARIVWEEIAGFPLPLRHAAVAQLVKLGEAKFRRNEITGRTYFVVWRPLGVKRRVRRRHRSNTRARTSRVLELA
jgi:hypothetical protein